MNRHTIPALTLVLACLAAPTAAHADLPQPVIEKAFQADPLIYDEQMAKLDHNGRFALTLMGRNLASDDIGHPANSGFVHIYARGITPDNKVGKWIPCGDSGDCKVYGSTAKSVISLGINPNFYLNTPGSHLQFRLWTSQMPSEKGTPEEAGLVTMVSAWSPIYTVDRAAAGVTKAKPVSLPPEIQRIKPGNFDLFPGRTTDWTVLIYGDHLCGGKVGVALDGRVVATPGGCSGVDVDGSYLPAHTAMLRFVLPEAYRRAGDYTLTLSGSAGSSNPVHLTVKSPQIVPLNRPAVAPPAVQTIKPGVIRPPVKPN